EYMPLLFLLLKGEEDDCLRHIQNLGPIVRISHKCAAAEAVPGSDYTLNFMHRPMPMQLTAKFIRDVIIRDLNHRLLDFDTLEIWQLELGHDFNLHGERQRHALLELGIFKALTRFRFTDDSH